jgi:hydrogenase maturation protease
LSKKIAVVGIGNTLMGDEGVGVVLVNLLEKKRYTEKIDFIDAGTSFFNIVSFLRKYDKVVIIDTVYGGKAPGSVYRFEINDIEEIDNNGMLSLHDFGVIQSIKLQKIAGGFPEDVVFFGVEPKRIELSLELSSEVQEKVDQIIDKILNELTKEGIGVLMT